MNRKLCDAEIIKLMVRNSYKNAEGIISNREATISSFNIQFLDERRKRKDQELSYYLISYLLFIANISSLLTSIRAKIRCDY